MTDAVLAVNVDPSGAEQGARVVRRSLEDIAASAGTGMSAVDRYNATLGKGASAADIFSRQMQAMDAQLRAAERAMQAQAKAVNDLSLKFDVVRAAAKEAVSSLQQFGKTKIGGELAGELDRLAGQMSRTLDAGGKGAVAAARATGREMTALVQEHLRQQMEATKASAAAKIAGAQQELERIKALHAGARTEIAAQERAAAAEALAAAKRAASEEVAAVRAANAAILTETRQRIEQVIALKQRETQVQREYEAAHSRARAAEFNATTLAAQAANAQVQASRSVTEDAAALDRIAANIRRAREERERNAAAIHAETKALNDNTAAALRTAAPSQPATAWQPHHSSAAAGAGGAQPPGGGGGTGGARERERVDVAALAADLDKLIQRYDWEAAAVHRRTEALDTLRAARKAGLVDDDAEYERLRKLISGEQQHAERLVALRAEYDQTYAAEKRYADEAARATKILDAANATEQQRASILAAVAQAYDPAVQKARAAADAAVAQYTAMEGLKGELDSTYAAQTRYAQQQQKVIDLYMVGAMEADDFAASMKRVEAVFSPAAQAAKKEADALQALTDRLDPAAAAARRAADAQALLDKARDGGIPGVVLSQEEHTKLSAALKDAGEAAAVSAGQMSQARRIVTSNLINMGNVAVATRGDIASMASPIPDIIYGFRLMGGAAATIATGVAVALAVVGGVVAAMESYRASINAVNDANKVMGDATGLTRGQLEELAGSLDRVSTRSGREMEAAFIRVGNVANDNLRGAMEVTRDFARATGQEMPEAAKTLADMLRDPAKGAEMLRDGYRALTSAQAEYVQRLAAQGEIGKAQQVQLDALKAKYRDFADEGLGYLARAMGWVGRTASNMWDALGQIGAPDTLEQQIGKLEDRLQKISARFQEAKGRAPSEADIRAAGGGELLDDIASKRAQQRAAAGVAQARAATAAAEDRMRAGLSLSKQMDTEVARQNALDDSYAALSKSVESYLAQVDALSQGEGRASAQIGHVRASLIQVEEAFDRVRNAKATYLSTTEKLAQQDEISLRYADQFGQQAERLEAYERKRLEIAGQKMTDAERQQALDSAVTQVIIAQTKAVAGQVIALEDSTRGLTDVAAAYGISASAAKAADDEARIQAALLGKEGDLRIKLEVALRAQAAAQRELAAAQFERGIQDQIKDATALLAVEEKGGAAAYETALAIKVANEARKQGRENDIAWIAATRDLMEEQDRLAAKLDVTRAKRMASLGEEFSTKFGQQAERDRARRAAEIEAEKFHPDVRRTYVDTKVQDVINSQTGAVTTQVTQMRAAVAATDALTAAYSGNAVAIKDAELAQKVANATLGMTPDLAKQVAAAITQQEHAERRLAQARADFDLRQQIEDARALAQAEAVSGAAVAEAALQNKIRNQVIKEGVALDSERAQAIEAGTRALEAQNAAAKVNGQIRQSNQDLTLARAEYDLLGSTAAERERAMGQLRAALEVQNDPAWQQAPEETRQAWIRQGGAIAEYRSRLEDAKRAGQDFASSLTKGLEDIIVEGGKAGDVFKELQKTFFRGGVRELITKPLNEMLSGAFTKLFAPTPVNDNLVQPVNDNDPGGLRKLFTDLTGMSGGSGPRGSSAANPVFVTMANGNAALSVDRAAASLPSLLPTSGALPVSIQDGGDIVEMIRQQAREQGVPEAVAMAVAKIESGFRQFAANGNVLTSRAGAQGVMQLMPGTASMLGVDPSVTAQNVQGGIRYLAMLGRQFGGDWNLAAAAYNAGPGRVGRWMSGDASLPSETQDYLRKFTSILGDAGRSTSTLNASVGKTTEVFAGLTEGATSFTKEQRSTIDAALDFVKSMEPVTTANDNAAGSMEVASRAIDRLSENAVSKAAEAMSNAADKAQSLGDAASNGAGGLLSSLSSLGSGLVSWVRGLFSSGGATGASGGVTVQAAGNGGVIQGVQGWGAPSTGGGMLDLLSGSWVDRQFGGAISNFSKWMSTPLYGGGGATATTAATDISRMGDVGMGAPSNVGGVTPGNMLGGAMYGLNAFMNFRSGNVIGGIGNTAATVMSFIPGLQPFAPFVAIGSQLLGSLFGPEPSTEYAGAWVQRDASGKVVSKASGADQTATGKVSGLEKAADIATSATISTLRSAGLKLDGNLWLGAESDTEGNRFKMGGWDGKVVSTSTDSAQVVADVMRALAADGKLSGNADVLLALKNSTATDAQGLMSDISLAKSFRPWFDAMTTGGELATQIKSMMDAAKEAGEQARTQLIEWRDKVVELGLATKDELAPALRNSVEAMLGLGPTVEPLRGLAAVTKQAEIQFEELRPILEEIGYTAAEQSDLLTRATQRAVDSYNAQAAEVSRRGRLSITQAIDPNYRMTASDVLTNLTLDPAKFPAFTTALDGMFSRAASGSADALWEIEREALQRRQNGRITDDQYNQIIAYSIQLYQGATQAVQQYEQSLTQAWQKVTTEARNAAQQAADAFGKAGDTLASTRLGLLTNPQLSPLSLEDRRAEAFRQLYEAAATAKGSDQDKALAAMAAIPQLAQVALQASRDFNASGPAYATDFDTISGILASTETVAQRQASLAREQVNKLDRLIGVTDSGLSDVEAALRDTLSKGDFRDYGTGAQGVVNRLIAAALPNYQGGFAAGEFASYAMQQVPAGAKLGNNPTLNAQLVALGANPTFGDGKGTWGAPFYSMDPSDPRRIAARELARLSGFTVGFEDGGIVGNGIWGRDSVLAQYAGGGMIKLAGGEGVLTAEATAAIGGAAAVDFINANMRLPANDRFTAPNVMEFRRPAASSEKWDDSRLIARVDRLIDVSTAVLQESVEQRREIVRLRNENARLSRELADAKMKQPRTGTY